MPLPVRDNHSIKCTLPDNHYATRVNLGVQELLRQELCAGLLPTCQETGRLTAR